MSYVNYLKYENCLKCGTQTPNGQIFCNTCSPRYGETTRVFDEQKNVYLTLFVGSIPFFETLKARIKGQNPVKWWMGTDALTMWFFPPGKNFLMVILHRIKMLLLEPFIYQHWVTGSRLIKSLDKVWFIKSNKVKVVYWPGNILRVSEKQKHDTFNILYYHPKNSGKFENWVYGIDVIEGLKERLSQVNWMRVDGNQDMRKIYPVIDLYIRPSRHDGAPRINLECQENGIPVLFSEDGNPTVEWFESEITEVINKVNKQQ